MAKLKIAGYLRISVDTELDKESTTIENQRDIITRYVQEHFSDYQLDFYEDRDYSGYTFDKRPDYQRMRPHLMNADYNILIIKDFSRFSRRNGEGLVELEKIRDAGVRIIAITDGVDFHLGRDNDWYSIQIRFFINEMPITDASRKVKSVIDSRQKKGEWVCAVPYGYVITNTKSMIYKVDDQASEIVKKVFELYLDGLGYKKIAEYLTERKIPTPRMAEKARKEAEGVKTRTKASSTWSVQTIASMLRNDFYIGTLRQRKYSRKKINGEDKKLDKEEHRVFYDKHEAIIDAKTFAKVQEQMKIRSKSNYRGIKKYDTTYSGFLFCGDCGSPMFSMSRPDLAPAYTCGSYHKHGTKKEVGGCTSHHTRIDTLDMMLKKYIERVMQNSECMIEELEKAINNEPVVRKKSQTIIESLEAELKDANEELVFNLKQKNQDLRDAEKSGYEPRALERKKALIKSSYDSIIEELESRIDGLEQQIQIQIDRENSTIQINRIAKTAIEIFRDILAKPKLDKGDLSLIVDKITVYDDNIEIQLKADITMLLETGTISEELLEQSSFIGNAVNFKWDTKSISNATIVQKANHQKDKAFSVNVVYEGDPLEIYTATDGEVIFKKYSPVGELSVFAAQYADVLSRISAMPTLVCDRDHVIAAAGVSKREYLERRVTSVLENYMESRRSYSAHPSSVDEVQPVEGLNHAAAIIYPIIAAGDVTGAVVMLKGDRIQTPTETELKLAQSAAAFLGKQMEE